MLSARPVPGPMAAHPALPLRPQPLPRSPCAGRAFPWKQKLSSLQPLCVVCFNYNLSDRSPPSAVRRNYHHPLWLGFNAGLHFIYFSLAFLRYYCHTTRTFKVGNVVVRYMNILQNADQGKVSEHRLSAHNYEFLCMWRSDLLSENSRVCNALWSVTTTPLCM